MITTLRSIERRVQRLAMDFYEKAMAGEKLLPLIAQVTPPQPDLAGQNLFTLEWASVFPRLRRWVGARKTQEAFSGSLEFRPEKYEITYDLDELALTSGRALVTVENTTQPIMDEFVNGRWDLAYEVLRSNQIAPIDGQNFFDTDHVHPDDTTYSNLISGVTRASASAPTDAEIKEEFRDARQRLIENRLIRSRVFDSAMSGSNLVAIARTEGVLRALENLRDEEEIGGNRNIFKGGFQLLFDPDPGSAPANSWDLIWAEPGGPRPVIFVPVREPQGIEFDETQKFKNGYVAYGAYSVYAHTPAFPQTAVRTQP